jgi:hypothetical protein
MAAYFSAITYYGAVGEEDSLLAIQRRPGCCPGAGAAVGASRRGSASVVPRPGTRRARRGCATRWTSSQDGWARSSRLGTPRAAGRPAGVPDRAGQHPVLESIAALGLGNVGADDRPNVRCLDRFHDRRAGQAPVVRARPDTDPADWPSIDVADQARRLADPASECSASLFSCSVRPWAWGPANR